METLRLVQRQPVEDDVENWDDDDFMIEGDDIPFRSSSNTAPTVGSRRNSHGSFRSDFDSVQGEEDQQLLLPGEDEKSTLDAIALAANAGIPLPKNVPSSALMGGTIKRLGGRKIKKIFQEDWGDDLELPDDPQPLHIKPQDSSKFPDALRQVSSGSTQPSPLKSPEPEFDFDQPSLASPATTPALVKPAPTPINLDQFRDSDDEDDFFGDGVATIKVSKSRQAPKPLSLITPPTPQKNEAAVDDDFELDLELPSDGKLLLSKRKEIPKTPALNAVDDFEWGEGSLGTRFGGTRRDGRSNRSSSVSAMSPSVSSSITAESEGEDDTFDGLVLPTGPVNFGEMLKKRRPSRSPSRPAATATEELRSSQQKQPQPESSQQSAASVTPASGLGIQTIKQTPQPKPEADKEDFLSGLDLGDGEVFDTSRLTLNRNVRVKEARPPSPTRPKTAVSITFTNKPTSGVSRLPRPMGTHERTHTTSSLEPVSESGGPIPSLARRSQSRLSHSAQSSVSSIPTPTTPSSAQSLPPSTPRRREGQKPPTLNLRTEPTTTNAQLLRLKRSLPVLRQAPSPAPRPITSRGFDRPPSRNDGGVRPQSAMRPKTPVERGRASAETAASLARKNPLPFLPAGASQSQSHHVTAKTTRTFRRHDSDTVVDLRPSSRAVSRSTMRSPSPSKRYRPGVTQEGTWQQLNKPRRQRNFGDGHELDAFDDLPTSSQAEAPYLRQPVSAGAKPQLRNKLYQSILPDRTVTPSTPSTLYSPARFDTLPHFARDTAASRIARETSLAQRLPSGPLAPLTAQKVAQLSIRSNYGTPHLPRDTVRSRKTLRRPPQLKPHLISNLGGAKESKTINGMFYNPVTMRWEGNENALSAFDPPASSPSTASIPPYLLREKDSSTPRPALITPIGATKAQQIVGGMVFDPENMCWLKVAPRDGSKAEADDLMDGFNGIDSDEDVFKDIPDLDDTVDTTEGGGGRSNEVKDDWLVGEEFDVGPEFVRRQREEEQRWRKKCERWMTFEDRDQSSWKWLLREMVTHPI